MRRRRIIGAVLAVLIAGVGTAALVGYTQSEKDAAVAKEAQVDVYLVSTTVPKGSSAETIKSSVALGKVPKRLEQPGAVTNLDQVGTKVAGSELQPGDQLVSVRLVDNVQNGDAPADKVQISAAFDTERAVGGTVRKGDTVGVYLSFDPFSLDEAGAASSADPAATPAATPKKSPNMTHLEFQHVLVTNVQTSDSQPVTTSSSDAKASNDKGNSAFVITLALSPEQSERFVFAQEFGHVWLSSMPATVADDGTKIVTLGNVFTAVK